MRLTRVLVATAVVLGGLAAVPPAHANHCKTDTSITDCPYQVNIIVYEGVGQVCDSVAGKIEDPTVGSVKPILKKYPGYKCPFHMDDPTWASKPVSPWNPTPDQGLYWPGVGPGGDGPYVLDVNALVDPPRQGCVSLVGGPGCQIHFEGLLEYGHQTNDPRTGAHCGSSHGGGMMRYTAADGSVKVIGTIGWDQSAATILPLFGQVDKMVDANGRTIPSPSGQKAQAVGTVSARGVGGAGNCGITQATTGFQVEGFIAIY